MPAFLPLTGPALAAFNNLPGFPPSPRLGDILNAIAVLTAYKNADEGISNNNVLQADDELFVDVTAGVTYTVQGILFFNIPADGIKVGFLGTCVPASMKVQAEIYDNNLRQGGRLTALGSSVNHSAVGPGDHYVTFFGSIEVQTAGRLSVGWSQQTADPATLTMQQGSSLILTPTVV